MKASELIKQLQKAIEAYGDRDIVMPGSKTVVDVLPIDHEHCVGWEGTELYFELDTGWM